MSGRDRRERMKNTALAAVLATVLVGGAAVAQQSGHAGHGQMGGMMKPTPANPYPPAEMKMHETMMGALGSDATETWVRKMIEHHRGGVEMSQIVLRETRDAKVRAMAEKTVAAQRREIAELEAWLREHRKRAQ
jgi:uncharacterized protein (DUF305 family)